MYSFDLGITLVLRKPASPAVPKSKGICNVAGSAGPLCCCRLSERWEVIRHQ